VLEYVLVIDDVSVNVDMLSRVDVTVNLAALCRPDW